jgi:putative ABC transport system permease protein
MNVLMRFLTSARQTWTTTRFAYKRLLTERLLSIAAVAGLMVAVGFIFAVPLYADAIYFRLFREELFAGKLVELENRPVAYAPLAFTYEFKAAGRNSPQWEDVTRVDNYLAGEGGAAIGLPLVQRTRLFHTDSLGLYPPLDPGIPETRYYLDTVRVAFINPMEGNVRIVAGSAPQASTLMGGGYIEAVANEELVYALGLQVGDVYYLRRDDGQVEIPVTIVGLWRPVDPTAPYWDSLSNNWLLVDEKSYTGAISTVVTDELYSCQWFMVYDGSQLHSGDIDRLKSNISVVSQRVDVLLPKTALTTSPVGALDNYQKNAPSLTFLLFAFSVPILGLIVVFIGLVTGLFVGQQRAEMAILRSRGASRVQVVWISLLQGILLGLVALVIGTPVGYWIAHMIGRAHSFLNFGGEDGLRVGMTSYALGIGITAVALILLAQILAPSLGASENTIITYKQERARLLRPPWWQRYWLDVILLLPAAYGFWSLQRQNAAGKVVDPLQNPLLLLVPALGIFAASLFALRLIPLLMDFISRILRPTKSVGTLMAARYLSRTPAFYTAPLILLILTLGLSAFTASLARTLDSQLEKQMNYQVGADLQVYELGTTANVDTGAPESLSGAQESGDDGGDAVQQESVGKVWTFPPVEEHLNLKGVRAATRVGRYKATTVLADGAIEGTYLGIDRLTFPTTAYWQKDFSSQSLESLMNALGATPQGVLVPASLLKDKKLKIGDPLRVSVQTGDAGNTVLLDLQIVGTFDLFPTWYPDAGILFVGNLDELYFAANNEFPHEVWMKLNSSLDPEDVIYGIRGYSIMLDLEADQSRLVEDGLNTFVGSWSSAKLSIRAEQSRPERQGLFGLLSVGFVASALLTVLGFMLYALFSFRRRFIEMGMLRAIGLSVRQMIKLLAAELAALVLLGTGTGTVLGVLTSRLFVPFLQMGASMQEQYPPFRIEIAWMSIFSIYILFAVLFVGALGVLGALLVRMKIFQAIKLGETN